MARHTLAKGQRVLWNCAFSKPLEVEVIQEDGFSPAGEPEYLVRRGSKGQPEWSLPQSVLHPIGSPDHLLIGHDAQKEVPA